MTIILFDTPISRKAFYPFTSTRPIATFFFGSFSVADRWQALTGLPVFYLTESYLQTTLPTDEYVYIDATIFPASDFVKAINSLALEGKLVCNHQLLAYRTKQLLPYPLQPKNLEDGIQFSTATQLQYPWELFQKNDAFIRQDFLIISHNKVSAALDKTNIVFNPQNIFIEAGATLRACVINAEEGPVFIGKNALVMEGTTIRGPVSIGKNAVVKMGTTLYGGTTIGPYCTAGGEIKNSILMPFSNKAHNGYLGDSVIGQWCNLGAGTSNSNVKNTGGQVAMWSATHHQFMSVAQKAGLLFGDYSRCAINTSFNTGSVVGVCCNVFGHGFLPKHIANFSWGNEKYFLQKAIADIGRWKQMKGQELSPIETNILQKIYDGNDQ